MRAVSVVSFNGRSNRIVLFQRGGRLKASPCIRIYTASDQAEHEADFGLADIAAELQNIATHFQSDQIAKRLHDLAIEIESKLSPRDRKQARDREIRKALNFYYKGTANSRAVDLARRLDVYLSTRWKIERTSGCLSGDELDKAIYAICKLNDGKSLSSKQVFSIGKGHRGRWKQTPLFVSTMVKRN